MAAARTDVPWHRDRLDVIVAGDARAALGIGLIASALLVGFDVEPPDVGAAAATPVLLAGAAAAVYLSSLVDWYVILPRVSGQLGARPCRGEHGEHPRFPKTWRETTRWWYLHRIAAALMLRFGLSFAITMTVNRHISLPGGAAVIAGAAVGGFAAYMAAVPKAFLQAGHPTLIVGRTVRRRSSKRLPLRTFKLKRWVIAIPGFKRVPVGSPGPREYVFDVALEGVQVVPVEERERAVPRNDAGEIEYENDPTKVPLKQVDACEPAKRPFAGCSKRCAGINWYCIENRSCFEPK